MHRWLFALLLLTSPLANAGIDHEWSLDQSGIWARKYQPGLDTGVIAVELAGAVWLGNDDEAGHVFWQSIDSSVISGVASFALKKAPGRRRPEQGNDTNAWFT